MDKRQRVLIVDDAKINRDIWKEILGENYNYLEYKNGNQAIQMIGDNLGILTDEEFKIMKNHSEIGAAIIKDMDFPQDHLQVHTSWEFAGGTMKL